MYIVCILYYVNIINTYTDSNSTTSCAAYPPHGVQPCFVGGLMALLQQLLIAIHLVVPSITRQHLFITLEWYFFLNAY